MSDKLNKGGAFAREAGILCREPLFHRFLEVETLTTKVDQEVAKEMVCKTCGVDSRRLLDHDEAAGDAWRDLAGRYEMWKRA